MYITYLIRLYLEYKEISKLSNRKTDKAIKMCKSTNLALAGVAQWIECRPGKQRVAGLIPSQGTCLGCRPGPQ